MGWMCEVISICLVSWVNVYGRYLWVRMDNDIIRTIDAMVIFHLNQSNPYPWLCPHWLPFLLLLLLAKRCALAQTEK